MRIWLLPILFFVVCASRAQNPVLDGIQNALRIRAEMDRQEAYRQSSDLSRVEMERAKAEAELLQEQAELLREERARRSQEQQEAAVADGGEDTGSNGSAAAPLSDERQAAIVQAVRSRHPLFDSQLKSIGTVRGLIERRDSNEAGFLLWLESLYLVSFMVDNLDSGGDGILEISGQLDKASQSPPLPADPEGLLTVEELGQRLKAKYPGTYDDFSDAELGKRIRAKYSDQGSGVPNGGPR